MPSVLVLFNGETIMDTRLDKEVYVVGRQEGCEIRIDNLGVSRNHARLIRDGSTYCVEDLNSANGTFVNGKEIQRHILNDGDVITISKFEIVYAGAGEESGEPARDEGRAAAVPGFDANINTMTMDSDAIRKRFEEMRQRDQRATATVDRAAPPPPPPPAPRSTARTLPADAPAGNPQAVMELRAREVEIEMLRNELRTTRLLMALFLLLAVGAVVALILSMR